MPSFISEQLWSGWKGGARRGKKPKERSKNSRHPNNGILRPGQKRQIFSIFKKVRNISEIQNDH
jgi:hypothetical protein